MVEAKIPCRNALTPAQDAVETAAGFYLGYCVGSGSPLPAGGNPPVFEKGTDKYLGDATPEHYKKWRAETRRARQASEFGLQLAVMPGLFPALHYSLLRRKIYSVPGMGVEFLFV